MRQSIEIDDLHKSYGQVQAVRGISLEIAPGEIFGLLGPNGAGKTTAVSILATLLKPSSGRVIIDGYDCVRDRQKIRRLIGYVPQDLGVYPGLTAIENVKFFGSLYGLRGQELRRRSEEVLDVVALDQIAGHRLVSAFSGGMKRRLNLAIGLINKPRILLLDEPTVGVDPQSRHRIFESILKLRDEGATILYTSHYMEEIEQLCGRVAIIDEGVILACDTVARLTRSLGSSILEIEVETLTDQLFERLVVRLPPGVEVSRVGERIRVRSFDGATAGIRALSELASDGVVVRDVEWHRPDLDQVYMQLTGKGLRDD